MTPADNQYPFYVSFAGKKYDHLCMREYEHLARQIGPENHYNLSKFQGYFPKDCLFKSSQNG
jgi:hypothetical protein